MYIQSTQCLFWWVNFRAHELQLLSVAGTQRKQNVRISFALCIHLHGFGEINTFLPIGGAMSCPRTPANGTNKSKCLASSWIPETSNYYKTMLYASSNRAMSILIFHSFVNYWYVGIWAFGQCQVTNCHFRRRMQRLHSLRTEKISAACLRALRLIQINIVRSSWFVIGLHRQLDQTSGIVNIYSCQQTDRRSNSFEIIIYCIPWAWVDFNSFQTELLESSKVQNNILIRRPNT